MNLLPDARARLINLHSLQRLMRLKSQNLPQEKKKPGWKTGVHMKNLLMMGSREATHLLYRVSWTFKCQVCRGVWGPFTSSVHQVLVADWYRFRSGFLGQTHATLTVRVRVQIQHFYKGSRCLGPMWMVQQSLVTSSLSKQYNLLVTWVSVEMTKHLWGEAELL